MSLTSSNRAADQPAPGELDWERVVDSFPGALLVCDQNLIVQQAHGSAREPSAGRWEKCVGRRAEHLFHPLSNFGPGTNLWTRLQRDGKVQEKVFDPRIHQFFQLVGTRLEGSNAGGYLLVLTEIEPQDQASRRADPAFRLAYLKQWIAGVACELNNPLQSIIGSLDMLRGQGTAQPLPPQLALIQTESQRAAELIKKLLLMTRAGPLELCRLPVNQTMEETVLDWQKFHLSRKINLLIQRSSEELYLQADRFQFQQLVQNLLAYLQHTLVATPDLETACIRISVRAIGTQLEMTFEHDGPPLPPEQASYLFDPFYAMAPGLNPGAGLSVCYTIVQGHAGQISCETPPGRGMAFRVEFPLFTAAAEPSDPAPARLEQTPTRLLLIDDEPSIGAVFGQLLKMEKIETDFITDANHAFGLIEKHNYDIILCDLNMPIMNGGEFYQRLSLVRPDMARRVIFATGDLAAKQYDLFQQNPALEVVYKPITSSKLLHTISNKLNRIANEPLPAA